VLIAPPRTSEVGTSEVGTSEVGTGEGMQSTDPLFRTFREVSMISDDRRALDPASPTLRYML